MPKALHISSHQEIKKKKNNNINQSIVWDHFTKLGLIDYDNPKAKCNYCSKQFGRLGSWAILSHLQFDCQKYPFKHQRLEKKKKKSNIVAIGT